MCSNTPEGWYVKNLAGHQLRPAEDEDHIWLKGLDLPHTFVGIDVLDKIRPYAIDASDI